MVPSSKKPADQESAPESGRRVKLKAQDPFDLIRLLARSQSDPRKAVAELVQNSLDAGARRIEIQWFNQKGQRALSIWDDGAGVFSHMERRDALRRIAQTIGHSHKRDLTPGQRREELILGKYGIGLIGFWSVGETLEMRSRVSGCKPYVLRMHEDREQGEVFASRSRRLDEEDTYTEVTILGLHNGALSKIRPARLQAYLATELRGQLVDRDAIVRIRDRVARGRSKKEFVVKPQPFVGRPLEGLTELEVPGYESARLELYLVAPEENRVGVVSLSCGGTVVLTDIAEIDGVNEPREPWNTGRFEGVIDFPDLHVAPASRRGFSHDEPVTVFLEKLSELELELGSRVASEARRREAMRSQQVAKLIRKAFVSVAESLPDYDFFDVTASRSPSTDEDGVLGGEPVETDPDGVGVGEQTTSPLPQDDEARPPAIATGTAGGSSPSDATERESRSPSSSGESRARSAENEPPEGSGLEESSSLFPPGPMVRLTLKPSKVRMAPEDQRTFQAAALDEDGRHVLEPVEFLWRVEGPVEGSVEPDPLDGSRALFRAPLVREETKLKVVVAARTGEGVTAFGMECTATVTIVPPDVSERIQGIPEPHPVAAPGEHWRSRMTEGIWEFNESHKDFSAVAGSEAQRVRYLIHLFAKEVVLRNFGRPGDAEVLERMVEVLTRIGGSK